MSTSGWLTQVKLSSPGKSAKSFALEDRATQYAAASRFIFMPLEYWVPAFAEDANLGRMRESQCDRLSAATGTAPPPPPRGLSLRASICFR